MCGIGGWIGPPDPDAAARMMAALHHRGPDDQGSFAGENASLLHKRLSIIDLARGHQPMANEDGRLQIVFNGEIYNHNELRSDLASRGHVFKTACDTEVIVHLYEEFGERCPEHLIGMFALAIWDRVDQRLFLARDRLGIKPLFYTEAPGGPFIFASELRAVLAHRSVKRELDLDGLDHYLTFMYVPAPRTIIRGVRKLLPGHTLTVQNGQTHLRRYWTLPAGKVEEGEYDKAVEELDEVLQEAVRCRLMSDVPLGAYLSGGLDSSLVVGMMSRASKAVVNTFSVGFEERGFDERPYSREVAECFHTRHTELVVKHHSIDSLPGIIRALDEPVADSAVIPTYFMAEATKPHVTVVLTGEGADELFAGYSHYKILVTADRMAAVSPGAAARWLGTRLGPGTPGRMASYLGRLRDRPSAYLALKSVFTEAEKAFLYTPDLLASRRTGTPPEEIVGRFLEPDGSPYLHQLLRLDLATWLADDLLVKVDRMTMAHAVEARVPYLDHRVVEAVMRMPPAWKLGMFEGKRILRRAASKLLPPGIVRRRKTGFAVPVGEWAAGEMRDVVQELLGPESMERRGLFQPGMVSDLALKTEYSMFERRQLWTLITLELWCREYLDQKADVAAL